MNKKGERSLLFGISLFLMLIVVVSFVLFGFFGFVIAAELDMTITGSNTTLSDTVRLKTNPSANLGKDVFDLEQSPAPPSDYVQFYSEITGYDLAIDVWNRSVLAMPRTLNLTFRANPAYTGSVNFSWALLTGTDFRANLTYFGNDSTYGTAYANVDMRSSVYYVNSSLSNEDYVYAQVYVWDYNVPPNNVTININSTDGSNKTLQNLNCYTTLADTEGDDMNVTVRWYKNGALNLTVDYNDSYANASSFNAILDDGNTSKTENWSCSVRIYDGLEYSAWLNTSNLTILNTAPTIDSIVGPANHNLTQDRTPTLDWTASDDDNDVLTYYINLSCYYQGSYVSSQSGVYTNSDSDYTPSMLRCLQDNNQNYNWSVRVSDSEVNSSWSSERNITIQSNVTVSLPSGNPVDFGGINISGSGASSNDTTDNNPAPFVLENVGNVEINVSINFTDLWDAIANPSAYFRFQVRQDTNCYADCSVDDGTWVNAYSEATAETQIITRLNFSAGYQNACDNVSVDIYAETPPGEYYGDKSSTIVFISEFAEPRVL